MSIKKSKNSNDRQAAFSFAAEANPSDVLLELKHALTRAIKRRGSRRELAEHLSRLIGEDVTEAMINSWTAESKPHVPPPQLIAPVCAWADDWRPMQVLANPYDRHLIDDQHKTLTEFGELYIEEQTLRAKRDMVRTRVQRAFFGGSK